jgi:hypothetical protein
MEPARPVSRRAHARTATGQLGLGLAGFILAAIPVLWLGLGGVELARWMQMRQSLSLILMDAARAGATRQGDPQAMAAAFERGLRILHPAAGESARILRERRLALGLPWHIAIRSPARAAFADHADPTLRGPRAYPGQTLIRNENQPEQHAARVAQGWRDGRGPVSGLTVFEANTLQLVLRWPHQPLFPGAGALIRGLAPLARDPRNRRWMAAGYLPFRRQVTIAMHSPPADWPDLPDGRITHESSPEPPTAAHPGTSGSPGAAGDAPRDGADPPGSLPPPENGHPPPHDLAEPPRPEGEGADAPATEAAPGEGDTPLEPEACEPA